MLEQFEQQLRTHMQGVMVNDQAHDLNHILRVVKTAKKLCQEENATLEVVLPAAYLHDCVSFPKDHPDRSRSSQFAADEAIRYLDSIAYPYEHFSAISHAIEAHSYSANVKPETIEAQIVQDADRLDALGAIGIARCLQVGSSLDVDLYQSDDPFCGNRALRFDVSKL